MTPSFFRLRISFISAFIDLAEVGRVRPRVDVEEPGVAVGLLARMDRVRQALPLADLLEEPRDMLPPIMSLSR